MTAKKNKIVSKSLSKLTPFTRRGGCVIYTIPILVVVVIEVEVVVLQCDDLSRIGGNFKGGVVVVTLGEDVESL